MKSTQNIKRTLFHNRASSEPKATASTAFMAKDGSPQFRNRSKTLDQKPKSLIEKPNGTVRERSKTVTLVKEDLKCVISGTTNGALNLRNIRSSESFFIHNLIPKYNFVILGLSKCGKTDLINTITTANYKNFYQIDFSKLKENVSLVSRFLFHFVIFSRKYRAEYHSHTHERRRIRFKFFRSRYEKGR